MFIFLLSKTHFSYKNLFAFMLALSIASTSGLFGAAEALKPEQGGENSTITTAFTKLQFLKNSSTPAIYQGLAQQKDGNNSTQGSTEIQHMDTTVYAVHYVQGNERMFGIANAQHQFIITKTMSELNNLDKSGFIRLIEDAIQSEKSKQQPQIPHPTPTEPQPQPQVQPEPAPLAPQPTTPSAPEAVPTQQPAQAPKTLTLYEKGFRATQNKPWVHGHIDELTPVYDEIKRLITEERATSGMVGDIRFKLTRESFKTIFINLSKNNEQLAGSTWTHFLHNKTFNKIPEGQTKEQAKAALKIENEKHAELLKKLRNQAAAERELQAQPQQPAANLAAEKPSGQLVEREQQEKVRQEAEKERQQQKEVAPITTNVEANTEAPGQALLPDPAVTPGTRQELSHQSDPAPAPAPATSEKNPAPQSPAQQTGVPEAQAERETASQQPTTPPVPAPAPTPQSEIAPKNIDSLWIPEMGSAVARLIAVIANQNAKFNKKPARAKAMLADLTRILNEAVFCYNAYKNDKTLLLNTRANIGSACWLTNDLVALYKDFYNKKRNIPQNKNGKNENNKQLKHNKFTEYTLPCIILPGIEGLAATLRSWDSANNEKISSSCTIAISVVRFTSDALEARQKDSDKSVIFLGCVAVATLVHLIELAQIIK